MRGKKGVLSQCVAMLVPKANERHHAQILELSLVVILPLLICIICFFKKVQIGNADIIVSGVGVLGGLLFAHAIFVFQLRMSYSEARRRRAGESGKPRMEKIGVSKMIDQMFYSVVYASGLSLFITLVVAMSSSFGLSYDKTPFPLWLSTIFVFLIAHLAGWVWYVISITVSAYRDLIQEL